MKELWVPIKGFEGSYEVSNLGRVRSIDRYLSYIRSGRTYTAFHPSIVLKTKSSTFKCSYVQLCVQRKIYNRRIDQLVAENWIPNPDNLSYIQS